MGRLTDFSLLGRAFLNGVFVETGSYKGESLENARKAGFKQLYGIEWEGENQAHCAYRFHFFPNVHIHLGSSPDVLPYVIDREQPMTFWLDAHYQGGPRSEMDPKYGECPLLAELKVIFKEPWKINPIVFIDDAKMFTHPVGAPFDPAQWPKMDEIEALFPKGYGFEIINDIIYFIWERE